MGKKEKFLSLEWFKERVEKSIEKAVDKKVSGIVNNDKEVNATSTPYLNIKLVNDSLIVVLRDGNIFTKPNATEVDYELIKNSSCVEEILGIIEDHVVVKEAETNKTEAEKINQVANGFQLLKNLKDFEEKENSLFLKGTSRTVPLLLVEKFAQVVGRISKSVPSEYLEDALEADDEYQGLKNFFMWCCLNPRAEVADSLYNFLHQNGMKITKQGFFVALRNVVEVTGVNNDLIHFISNAYNKVKAVLKKSPSNYCVLETEEGLQLKRIYEDKEFVGKNLGNLSVLYEGLSKMEENRFTDNWTKTFDIRIGQVVSMPSEKCDWSTQDCARAGLHFAGHTAPYVLCGDTTVFTLHNPMKVVGIGTEKGRCWEYLPFMTTNINEADAIMTSDDFDFLQLDEQYALSELEELRERAKEGFVVEANKYKFNLPSISTDEINSIVKSLEEMRDKITKRVSLID